MLELQKLLVQLCRNFILVVTHPGKPWKSRATILFTHDEFSVEYTDEDLRKRRSEGLRIVSYQMYQSRRWKRLHERACWTVDLSSFSLFIDVHMIIVSLRFSAVSIEASASGTESIKGE